MLARNSSNLTFSQVSRRREEGREQMNGLDFHLEKTNLTADLPVNKVSWMWKRGSHVHGLAPFLRPDLWPGPLDSCQQLAHEILCVTETAAISTLPNTHRGTLAHFMHSACAAPQPRCPVANWGAHI